MVTLAVQPNAAETDAVVGVAQLLMDDPEQVVTDVWFDIVRVDGAGGELSRVSVPADAVVDVGVFQISVALDPANHTRIGAHVTTPVGDIAAPTAIDFEPAAPNEMTMANRLASCVAICSYWQLLVGIEQGSVAAWRCYARPDQWPTIDGAEGGTFDERFLRIEGRRDDVGLDIGLSIPTSGYWYAIVVGVAPNGIDGPRYAQTLAFEKDAGDVPTLQKVYTQHISAVERRKIEVLSSLAEFTDWLAHNDQQRGFLGEYGWPWNESASWNEIADAVLTAADAANLWGCAWAVGDIWGPNYALQPFVKQNGAWVDEPQQTVLAAHPTTPTYERGLNFAGAEFGSPVDEPTSSFSNVNRGFYDVQYHWNGLSGDHPNVYEHAASLGHKLARIPFRWERLQPVLEAPLDASELDMMRTSVSLAISAGLDVILDVHNYGAYYIDEDDGNGGRHGVRYSVGSPQVPFGAFADLWRRIAIEFNDMDGVVGYGLMNEPVAMTPTAGVTPAQTWELAAQAAVAAIRGVALSPGKAPKWVMCAGYEWSGTWSLMVHHATPFANDPENKTMYEGHLYFDADRSGRYQQPEFSPPYELHWIRWDANAAMWRWDSAPDDGTGSYHIELYRVGEPARLQTVPLWQKGASDDHIDRCTLGSSGCAHHTYEYRVVAINRVDGSTIEYGAALSGAFIDQ